MPGVSPRVSLASAATPAFGIYIHFPWCRKLCPYCDFAVEVAREPPHEAYADAVLHELRHRLRGYADRALTTIYFGGGTPSLWSQAALRRVLAGIKATVATEALQEVTLEANPIDCHSANLDGWAASGINRLSIGVQSTAPQDLVVLRRDHRLGDGEAAVVRAHAHGSFIVSADFIIGTPSGAPSTPAQWVPTVQAWGVPHVSVYELTIEARTSFGKRTRAGLMAPLDESVLTDLYCETHARLTTAGFEHYEISSYAKPGARAVHNALYWAGAAYLGVGVGAASLQLTEDGGGIRRTNPRRWAAYIAAQGAAAEEVQVTASERAVEDLWLGLRTSDGVRKAALAPCGSLCEELCAQGLLAERGERVVPTLKGFLFADTIAAQIVQRYKAFDQAPPLRPKS